MIDDNEFLKEVSADFETKLHEPEKQEPIKEKKHSQPKNKLKISHKHLKLAGILIVVTLMVTMAVAYIVYKRSTSATTGLLSADTADITSFDDYINSNIGINFRYPHLWQVYDTADKIVIANCTDADRATCQAATGVVQITIKPATMPADIQLKKTTYYGYGLYVNSASYYLAKQSKQFQIDQVGLSDTNRDAILDRIFDSIVIN